MKLLKISKVATLIFVITLFSACGTRSISNSGYHADPDHASGYDYNSGPRDNAFYKGELNELDVLGIDAKSAISEEDIQNAIKSKWKVTVQKGSTVMLIQSGATIPDEDMVKGMEKYYNVSVFTGVPTDSSGYSKVLRLAAAKGGAEKLIVYWGLLESGQEDLATKAISWIPFVGGAIHDETQPMRIRMKVAVVDVKSGQWDMFSPEPFNVSNTSGSNTRASSDQAQVAILKEKAYKATADDVVKRYSK
jgi:hypothetical protein